MKSKDYRIRIYELEELYNICKKVSSIDLGRTGKTERSFILEDIVEKLLLHVKTIIIIFMTNKAQNNDFKELDISAIASLARNIMDCSNLYYYFGERKINKEELRLRFNISNLHASLENKKIYNKLNFKQGGFRWSIEETSILNTKRDIKESDEYKKLSKQEKERLPLGEKQKKNYCKKRIFDENLESSFYNLLSQSVHSFNGGLGNNSTKSELLMFGNYFDIIKLLFISCEISIIYTSNVISDYLALIKRLNKNLDLEEKSKIIALKDTKYLIKWIETIRKEYNFDLFKLS